MKHLYERKVPVTMRDGVTLRANVWRPLDGQAPTLLVRTPYQMDATGIGGGPNSVLPALLSFLNAGYAVVHQDCRGTYQSDGAFTPKINEIADGEDAAAWIVGQDWSDGSIGTYGPSYLGMTQWALAIGNTPGLAAIAPTTASADWYKGLWYSQGGALCLSLVLFWNAMMYAAEEQRALQRGESSDPTALMRLGATLLDPLSLTEATPVADLPVIGKGRWFDDWLAHPDFDDYWKAQDWSARIDSVTGQYPDRYYGPLAAGDMTESHVGFFDQTLRGIEPAAAVSQVRIFVMGIDQWRDEQDWPLPDTHYADYYLHSGGSANTRDGDGTLDLHPPSESAHDEFRYDPRDPVPTAGGALLPSHPGLIGPVDQCVVDSRSDVLCYTGPVLTEAVEVTGFVELKVFVSSTAVDTDITAKLIDVFPDGRAINLCDGILRLRYRNSLSQPELMTPGEVYEVTVPMSVTSNVFLPGHRIRLDVSSSNFPHYDRNSNTGGVISWEALDHMLVAHTTVHHGGPRPSRLVLPIIKDRQPEGEGS